jgi:hypothetical protein
MRPVTITASASGGSTPVVLDFRLNPFSVAIGCVVSAGATLTYTIQHTFDDPFQSGGLTNATWFDHDDSGLVNQTGNANGNYAFPVRASRINVTAYTGGSVTVTYVQSGH